MCNSAATGESATAIYRGHETVYSKVLELYILPCRARQSTTLPLTVHVYTRLVAPLLTDTVCALKYRARDIQTEIRVFHMTHSAHVDTFFHMTLT